MRLANELVLVVGAGTRELAPNGPVGNGRAIAVQAAREGATVACLDVDPTAVQGTVDLIVDEGGAAVPVVCDVTDEESIDRAVAEVAGRGGPIDGLVLNVGTGAGSGLETSLRDWDRIFALNIRSHFAVTRAAAPHVVDGGSIVYISSVAAGRPFTGMPAYDSSKVAVEGLARHVARELSPRGIRANTVRIGLVDTPIGRAASRGRPDRESTTIPLGRQGSPWEVATVVAFFLSQDASYVTGQTLAVDGGLTSSG